MLEGLAGLPARGKATSAFVGFSTRLHPQRFPTLSLLQTDAGEREVPHPAAFS
jgi:hypothetical protein